MQARGDCLLIESSKCRNCIRLCCSIY